MLFLRRDDIKLKTFSHYLQGLKMPESICMTGKRYKIVKVRKLKIFFGQKTLFLGKLNILNQD